MAVLRPLASGPVICCGSFAVAPMRESMRPPDLHQSGGLVAFELSVVYRLRRHRLGAAHDRASAAR